MRIVALEKEIARYKAQLEAETVKANSNCSVDELLQKIDILEKVQLSDVELY